MWLPRIFQVLWWWMSNFGTCCQALEFVFRVFWWSQCISISFQVLDAPGLQDDFYLNLVDWSSQNVLAVGLENSIYLWNACSSKVSSNFFANMHYSITSGLFLINADLAPIFSTKQLPLAQNQDVDVLLMMLPLLWSIFSSNQACYLQVTKLCDLGNDESICSVGWAQRGTHLAVGTGSGKVEVRYFSIFEGFDE